MAEPILPFGPAHGFGLYVHWPYCARICPYCDFNVYAAKSRDTEPLFTAMLADLATQAAALPDHPPLSSIFFGGGTPSLMSPLQIEGIITASEALFGLSPDCEITLEANPNTVCAASARDWIQAGINRLSIGLQSLDNAALTFLGRDHTAEDARQAVDVADAGFASFSIDMIYARPDQNLADWERELSAALALGAPHLSLYELTISPGTAFGKAATRGTLTPLPDTVQAELYEITEALTQEAGLPAYEISNHAKTPAHHSRHNLTYWRSGDWLGIGPGAHGRLSLKGQRITTEARAKPADYIREHARGSIQNAHKGWETLTTQETLHELITMGLRPAEGIDISRIAALIGQPSSDARSDELRANGWLTADKARLALTPAGRLLADRIALELVS